MFEATMNTIQAQVVPVDPRGGDTPTEMHVIMLVGLVLPFAGPDGQPIQAPLGQLRFPLNKPYGTAFLEAGLTVAESLADEPKASDITIATSLSDAERLAKIKEQFQGKNDGR